jgi:phosphoribosyl-ATP pyrophosphohydrolase
MSDNLSQADILARVAATLESRKPENGGDPEKSYVAKLFKKGDDAILKKIGEEATETVMAAKDARAADLADEAVARWSTRWPTCGSTPWCCWLASA